MVEVEVRIDCEQETWGLRKKFKLSALPPVGAHITTTKAGGMVVVDIIDVWLDTNTFIVNAKGIVPDLKTFFRDDEGWELVEYMRGAAEKDLGSP